MMDPSHKFSDPQIESILDRLVPLIAAPEDRDFFRGVLQIKAEETSSGHFAYFVSRLLAGESIVEPYADRADIHIVTARCRTRIRPDGFSPATCERSNSTRRKADSGHPL